MTDSMRSSFEGENLELDRVGRIMQEIHMDPDLRYPNPLAVVAFHGANIARMGYGVTDIIEVGQACSENSTARPTQFSHLKSLATEIFLNTLIEDEPLPGMELIDD